MKSHEELGGGEVRRQAGFRNTENCKSLKGILHVVDQRLFAFLHAYFDDVEAPRQIAGAQALEP